MANCSDKFSNTCWQPAYDTMNVKKYWFNICTLNYILIYCVYLPNFESLLNNSYKVNKCTTREY